MSSYCHLTRCERKIIGEKRKSGCSIRSIARALGRSPSTVSREVSRNGRPTGGYSAAHAQRQAAARGSLPRPRPVTGQSDLMSWVERNIRRRWSPEQIAGRLAQVDSHLLGEASISHTTIYRWLRSCPARWSRLSKHLRQGCRKRRKAYGSGPRRPRIRNRRPIGQRPAEVQRREEIGHWEADTVVGAGHRGVVLTCTERFSRYLVTRRLDRRTAPATAAGLVDALNHHDREKLRTMTFDNGLEFAHFEEVERRLELTGYFADPYSSWQRGTNENTNGLLRQYIPKGMDLTDLKAHELESYTSNLNNRPRKCLNYRTPAEVYHQRGVALLM